MFRQPKNDLDFITLRKISIGISQHQKAALLSNGHFTRNSGVKNEPSLKA
jgi:hypothetical protein